MYRLSITVLLLLGLCLSTGNPTALTASYGLDVDNSVDIPTREVTIKNTTHEVSAVAKTAPGNTLSVAASAPSGESYRVYLYRSSDQGEPQIADQQPGTGESTVTFDLTGYNPGTYLLALYKDGDYKAVYPVVIRGYEVTVDAPSRATPDSTITVTVTATKTDSVEDPATVTVVLATDTQTERVTAAQDDSQTYHATLSLANFPEGTARLYAAVKGSDNAFKDDQKEYLGISNAASLTVAQQTTTTTMTAAPDSSGSTDTTTTNSTTVHTTTATTQPTVTSTTSSSTTTPTQRSSSRPSPTSTTDNSVITPAQSTTTTPSPAQPAIPGFGISSSLVALCCLLILTHRR